MLLEAFNANVPHQVVVCVKGNPWVYFFVPLPLPIKTLTFTEG